MSEPPATAVTTVARGRLLWHTLSRDQRAAAAGAVALFASMFLPWYQYTDVAAGRRADRTINAFGAFDFTEAAVLLVAGAILTLVVARGEGRRFSLPGRDGTFVLAGGIWSGVLIFLRQLDKPDGPASTVVGVSWGIFVAFVASLVVAAAGWRMRSTAVAVLPKTEREHHDGREEDHSYPSGDDGTRRQKVSDDGQNEPSKQDRDDRADRY